MRQRSDWASHVPSQQTDNNLPICFLCLTCLTTCLPTANGCCLTTCLPCLRLTLKLYGSFACLQTVNDNTFFFTVRELAQKEACKVWQG